MSCLISSRMGALVGACAEPARVVGGAGVSEPPRYSPIVARVYSQSIPWP